MPEHLETPAFEAAARGLRHLVAANPETTVTLFHEDWPESALAIVPEGVACERLHARAEDGE